MAVIDVLPGVNVCIEIDEQALKEYEDTDEEDPSETVTRYVEAQSKKVFKIKCAVERDAKCFQGTDLAFYVTADGTYAAGALIPKSECQGAPYVRYIEGLRRSEHTVQPFVFSELEICTWTARTVFSSF